MRQFCRYAAALPRATGSKYVSVVAIFAFGLLWAARSGFAGSNDTEKLASFVVAGMKDQLSKLRSGEFRAFGKEAVYFGLEHINEKNRGTIIEIESGGDYGWTQQNQTELRFYVAFDWERERHRVDRTEKPLIRANQRIEGDQGGGGSSPESTCRWARSESEVALWSSRGAPLIAIQAADTRDISLYRPRLDPRTLPVLYYHNLRNLEADFGEWWDGVEKRRTVIRAEKEDGNLYRIIWSQVDQDEADAPELTEHYAVWFDGNNGFVPVRMEVRVNRPEAKPRLKSETTWKTVDGVLVPETYHALSYVLPCRQELHLSFEWVQVNKSPAEDRFNWRGLGAPRGTEAWDRRLSDDRPILVGRVGEIIQEHPIDLPTAGYLPRSWIITLNVIALVIGAIIFCIYKARAWWRR